MSIRLHFKSQLSDNDQIRKLSQLNPFYKKHEVSTTLLVEYSVRKRQCFNSGRITAYTTTIISRTNLLKSFVICVSHSRMLFLVKWHAGESSP